MEDSKICGLVGVAGKVGQDERKAFVRLLQLDTIRGPHSTGVVKVESGKNRGYDLIKKLGTPWDLAQYKSWDPFMRDTVNMYMGHNRWATKGAINAVNAHPFEFDNVVGMHNGTLRNQSMLDDHRWFDVDSENLYYHMDKNGLDHTLMRTDGAFALTWYNPKEDTLNVIRNKERPLYWCMTEDLKSVFWASEQWMLQIALSSNGIKYGEIFEFEEHKHYKLDIPHEYSGQAKPLPKWLVTEKKVYEKPVYQNNFRGGAGNNGQARHQAIGTTVYFKVTGRHLGAHNTSDYVLGRTNGRNPQNVRIYAAAGSEAWNLMLTKGGVFTGKVTGYSTGDKVLLITGSGLKLNHVVTVTEANKEDASKKLYLGFNETKLPYTEWLRCTKNGCAWCSDVAMPKEHKELVWVARGEFVCPDCADTQEVKNYLGSGA